MQNSPGNIKIFTQAQAPEAAQPTGRGSRIRIAWPIRHKPKPASVHAEVAKDAQKVNQQQPRRPKAIAKTVRRKLRPHLSPIDKLMRNSAVACALLLTVLALQNVNQPWTRTATERIKQVLTMRIDLDESLGRLNFVRGLVPDTALVFWNMGSEGKLQPPVNGTAVHEYSALQPWIEFVCRAQQSVVAADVGTVTAVMQDAQGDWTLLIDHDGGAQTVYAYMAQALVQPGDTVEKGAQIGITADAEASRLYFELRKDGVPQDPALN